MRRKIYSQLLDWKQNIQGKTALLIEGARRIGKSYIIEEFAKNEYDTYILIDFNEEDGDVRNIFREHLSHLDMFFQLLSLHYDVPLIPRKSLIIFDEVQQFPRARAAIKYLVADGRYDYIETGSLISIKKNVRDIVIPSEEEHVPMYPMDFEEFLWAMGNETLMPYIRDCFVARKPLGVIHRKAMELFRLYMTVGGMPQVVKSYVETRDFHIAEQVKQNILTLYRDDIRKYATGAELKAVAVFDAIPAQLQQHATRFVLTDLEPNARFSNYESAFFWLSDSRIVHICYNTFAPNIGLRMNTERTSLKCYMADTGLLVSLAFNDRGSVPSEVYERLLRGKLEANLSMIMENMVAQMLRAAGHDLYFYSKSDRQDASNDMEIDFLISARNITSRKNISPIEVKSSNRYTTTSLRKCMSKFEQQIGEPFVLHTADVEVKDGITYLPLYMTGLL